MTDTTRKPAKITEKLVKEKVKKIIDIFAQYTPLYTFCPMTFGFGESGHPDRIVLVNGVFIGVEVKRDNNNHHCRPELKPKPNEIMQKRQADKIHKAGGVWLCINNETLATLIVALSMHSDVTLADMSKEHENYLSKFLWWL